MCLEPLLLAGWLLTQTLSGSVPKTNLDAGVLEVQTCERGIGLDLKASTSGLYGLAVQYGLSTTLGGWTITLTPKAGLAYVDHRIWEERSPGNFEAGGQLLIGRNRWRIGAEYWHISNAYLGRPNYGLDLVMLQGGWIF
jgi:hypothetical protein